MKKMASYKANIILSGKTHESPQRFFGISISSSRKLTVFEIRENQRYFGFEQVQQIEF